MDYRQKLFAHKDVYGLDKTAGLFLSAVRGNLAFHLQNCPEYAAVLARQGFVPEMAGALADVADIPPLSTLFFKRHTLFSLPASRLAIQAKSSGTQGSRSHVGFDKKTLSYGVRMVLRVFARYDALSAVPAHYIVLGYQPSAHNEMGAAKTAYYTTKFAPALHREYALKDTGDGYAPNIDGVRDALMRYAKSPFPVRFVGFPAYMYFLVQALRSEGVRLSLGPRSMVLLGGGWKQFSDQRVDKQDLFDQIEETLGIDPTRILEFYSAVEHPVAYCACKNHRFHVPIYSRAIVRDVVTLKPVQDGVAGLLSFVTPLVGSLPLTSVVTDDIAILRSGADCGCGNAAPCFELLGRAGLDGIKTCAADAAEILMEVAP